MGEIPLCARNTQDVLRKDTEHTKEFKKTRMGFLKKPGWGNEEIQCGHKSDMPGGNGPKLTPKRL